MDIISRENLIANQDTTKIEFRLRFLDPRKRASKHKENEAIQFDFDMVTDDCDEICTEMCRSNIIGDDDLRVVANLMKIQIANLKRDRREKLTQERFAQYKTATLATEVNQLISQESGIIGTPNSGQELTTFESTIGTENNIITNNTNNNNNTNTNTASSTSNASSTATSTTTASSNSDSSKSNRIVKKRSNKSAERSPKLEVLSISNNTLVECQMENKQKTIKFKFDIGDVNFQEIANDLVSN